MKKATNKFTVLRENSGKEEAMNIELAFSSYARRDLVNGIFDAEPGSHLLYHTKWCPCPEDKEKYYLRLQLFDEEQDVIKTVRSRTDWEYLDKKTYLLSRSSREHMEERKLRERRLLRRAIRENPIALRMLVDDMEDLIIEEIYRRLNKMSDKELKELLDLRDFDPDTVRRRK